MRFTENLLERKGCTLHYWMGGKADDPLVVFTHGATIDHHEWDATLPLVAEAGYQVLAWDMRAHGLSRPARFILAEAVDDLLALLDRNEAREAVFIGHSLGGNLHQELVFHHPERVRAMVFLDCTWNFQKLTPFELWLLKAAEPIFHLHPYRVLQFESLFAAAAARESRALLRRPMSLLTKDEVIQIMMAALPCLHYEPEYRIGKPLLLMIGDRDMTGNIRKAMPAWARQEPDCEFVVIRKARHAANLDQPEVFHRTLLNFLQRRVG